MRAKTVGFAIADEDRELLDRLVNKYADGNRSEFLRIAMKAMARQEMAERLMAIQAEFRRQSGGKVYTPEEVEVMVRKVKGKSID